MLLVKPETVVFNFLILDLGISNSNKHASRQCLRARMLTFQIHLKLFFFTNRNIINANF